MTGWGLEGLAGLDGGGHTSVTRALTDLRRRDPQHFLEEIVLDPGFVRAVRFKIKYEELHLPDYARLLEWLKSDRENRVLHLRRENRLKRPRLTTSTLKLNSDDPRSVLENYEALAAALHGPRYAECSHGR